MVRVSGQDSAPSHVSGQTRNTFLIPASLVNGSLSALSLPSQDLLPHYGEISAQSARHLAVVTLRLLNRLSRAEMLCYLKIHEGDQKMLQKRLREQVKTLLFPVR